jgi:hypothetical protein
MYSNGLTDPSSCLSTRPSPRTRLEDTSTKPPLKPSSLASSSYLPLVAGYITDIPTHSPPTAEYLTPISNLIKIPN